ncbi:MAG: cupredoxin domain-containing protein [Actinomycetota bacterium]
MRRLFVSGVLLEVALLIVGLTWIHGPGESGSAQKPAAAIAAAEGYKTMKANGTVVNVNLTAYETTQEIAPGVPYHVWTFNGTSPGPTIRVHLGDTVHFTLTNASSIGMQHSIDFHAAMTPWDKNYQPVDPGKTKTFDWVAMYPGAFLYHCGVPPVLQHISNGMYGAIIVEPNNLPKEREYVLLNSEFYPGDKPVHGVYEGDYDKMLAAKPGYVVWNGKADQYKDAPLEVQPNERFRLWVVNAGPTLTSAFHIIGTMMDVTYVDGNPANPLYGLQTWNIAPGGGAMFEVQIPEAGLYPFVTHAFAYTGLGAVGLIKVDPNAPAPPTAYPMMADPFSAGVAPAAQPNPTAASGGGGMMGGSGSGGMGDMPGMGGGSTSSGGGSTSAAACAPNGTKLVISAQNVAFSTDCLAAPAGKAFTIVFDNKDPGVPHNISIYTDDSASTALFTGDMVSGPAKTTYTVPALDPGTYFFRCDVHPTTMTGTFVVK